jgi:enoyl-CoA hydratase
MNQTSRQKDITMNDANTVIYEVRDGIATVKINRPEIRNALSPAAANRLHDCWGEVDADKNVRVAILTSADCGTFCAGLDLREAARVKGGGRRHPDQDEGPLPRPPAPVCKPIIAAMTGHLIAGGMMLSLNSDLRVGLKGTQVGITETASPGAAARGPFRCCGCCRSRC